ncbi:MAG: hypothetical protein WD826_06220, partial [Actinomycetota bacterium]
DAADFSRADQVTLQSDEPSLTFVGTASSADPQEVSTTTECVGTCGVASKHNRFVAAVRSASGTCWFAQSVVQPGLTNAGVTWEQAPSGDCDAASAPVYDSAGAPAGWVRAPGDSLP